MTKNLRHRIPNEGREVVSVVGVVGRLMASFGAAAFIFELAISSFHANCLCLMGGASSIISGRPHSSTRNCDKVDVSGPRR